MKKQWIRTMFFAVLTVFLLTTGVLASEKDRPSAYTAHRQQPTADSVILLEERPVNPDVLTSWPSDGEYYFDALRGDTRDAYLTMFNTLWNYEMNLHHYDFEGDGKAEAYWNVPDVLYLPYGDDYETWFAENAERLDWLLWDAVNALVLDNPEFFMIAVDYYWELFPDYYEQGYVAIDVNFTASPESDTWDGDESEAYDKGVNGYTEAIYEQAEEILTKTEGMTTVETLAYFDYWLAWRNYYSVSAANGCSEHDAPWNLVGSLVLHGAVCEGYAKAFQFLCQTAGIPCLQVYSDTHMWNEVKVDSAWYMVDPTWNDPLIDDNGATRAHSSREYFLRPHPTAEEDGSNDHVIAMDLPTPTVSKTDYFTQWTYTAGGISGGEAGRGSCLMGLYAADGQMLQCLPCRSFSWKDGMNMYVAPVFDADSSKNASYAVRFFLDETFQPTAKQRRLERAK